MKKALFVISFVFSLFTSAQVQMRDVFASMPDSLLSMMTKNNRLDCIDFIENNMEAKVRDRLDQFVELKKLTSDYLLLETSEASCVEMKLVASSDSTATIYMVRTVKGPAADSFVTCFDQDWNALQCDITRPSVDAFFAGSSEAVQTDTVQDAILMLKDLTFLEARLSETEPTLTWTIGLDELSKEEKKAAQQCVRHVTCSLSKR